MFKKGKSEELKKIKQKAEEAYAKNDWKKSLDAYKEWMDQSPFDPRIVQRIGDLHRRLKQNGQAIGEYRRVADYYSSEGYWAKAIALNKVILELDPQNSDVQTKIAHMYALQSQPKGKPLEPIELSGGAVPPPEKPIEMYGSYIDFDAQASPQPVMDLEPLENAPTPNQTLGQPVRQRVKIPLFSELNTQEFVSVLEKLTIRKLPEGSLICEEGDIGSSMYVISEGIVEVYTKDVDGTKIVLARLRGGDFFGEYSLITRKERNASVMAKTDVELLEITGEDFEQIAKAHPRIWSVLEDYLRKRMVHTIMVRSPVFHVLHEDEREALSRLMMPKSYKAGEVIMKEGTDGDEMYFIKTGSVSVNSEKSVAKVTITQLSSGDFFGEMAMLSGKQRMATVRALTDVELFCLKRVDAAKVLRGNRDVLVLLQSKMKERSRETHETLESYREAQNTLTLV